MKNENTKEFSEVFEGFGGIDLTSPIGGGRLSGLKNFRLLSDGSAVKRCGFDRVALLDGGIRGAASYVDGGEEVILAVSSSYLCRVTLDGEVSRSHMLDSEEGEVDFFELRGELYLTDGAKFYRYAGGTALEPCSPHAPLYGKNWIANSVLAYTVNEPLNLLTSRIRIQYRCGSDQVNVLAVGVPIASIDGVFVDGIPYDMSCFSMHRDGNKVACSGFYPGTNSEIVLYVTLEEGHNTDGEFTDYRRAEVFDSFDSSRVFLYGGGDGGSFYVSSAVSEELLAQECSVYGRVDPLYFPKGESMRFGGLNDIKGMCRVRDRMVIFTPHRAWMTSSLCTDEGMARRGVELELISETVGCAADRAVRVTGGAKPITVSRSGVFKWTFDSEFEEEAVISKISERVEALLTDDFLKNAMVCYDRVRNELWIGNRASEDGTVLIFDCNRGLWWSYDGVWADRFIETGCGVAFTKDDGIYLFNPNAVRDFSNDGGRDIEAVMESAGFDFSVRSKCKQVVNVSLLGELDGGSVALVIDDGHPLVSLELDGASASPIHAGAELVERRTCTNRTERVKFYLRAGGTSRQRIYAVGFRATT